MILSWVMRPPFEKLAKLMLFLPYFIYFGSNKALGGLFPLQLEANSPPPFFKGYFSQIGPVVKIMKYWVKYYFHNRKTTGLLYGCCVPVVKIIFYPVFHYYHNTQTTRLLCGCCENKGGRTLPRQHCYLNYVTGVRLLFLDHSWCCLACRRLSRIQ